MQPLERERERDKSIVNIKADFKEKTNSVHVWNIDILTYLDNFSGIVYYTIVCFNLCQFYFDHKTLNILKI